MAHILVIDDDETFSYVLKRACTRQGHAVSLTASVREAKAVEGPFDVVFLDISLPDGNGLALLPLLRELDGHPEIIVITGHDNLSWVEQALTGGAWDFIRKDDSLDTIFTALEQVLLYRRNRSGVPAGPEPAVFDRSRVIGSSPAISRCLEAVATCAGSDICVLLSGETGTGKDVFARTIHENSRRRNGPLVVVDCAALPEQLAESLLFGHVRGAFTGATTRENGLILEAGTGTLFLDEIGELPLSLQKVFLRVLQEKKIRPVGSAQETACDFRLIAATNRDLGRMVEEGTFRRDLFYRIQAASIELPAVRDRREDILPLARHFTAHFMEFYSLPPKELSAGTLAALEAYDWPGNVRELSGAIEHAVISAGRADTIFPQHLPTGIRIHAALNRIPTAPETQNTTPAQDAALPSYAEFREQVWQREEGRYLSAVLGQAQGNIVQSCRITGLSRSRLYALLKRHGLT